MGSYCTLHQTASKEIQFTDAELAQPQVPLITQARQQEKNQI